MKSDQKDKFTSLQEVQKFQYEVANETNKIPMGYAGTVGGNMVKKMIEKAEKELIESKDK